MLLSLGTGTYVAVNCIAKIIIRGNEPCKIWIKTLDGRWHYWRQCNNQEEAEKWISDLLGEYII